MFSFFKKKKSGPTDLSWLNADMHSHLLPGIDDGSPDLETSLELVKGFVDLGYKKLITTPHILWDMYPNTPSIIMNGLQTLRTAVSEKGWDIELHAAAEYFIDEHFVQELAQKAPFLTLKDKLVLVEISTVTAPFDFQEVLFELQLQNYQPVIAHPERYIYLRNNKSIFDDLKDAGFAFQLNLLSITGHYGIAVQELAGYLLKKGYYDYAGSDLHHAKHLPLLRRLNEAPLYEKLLASEQIRNHLL